MKAVCRQARLELSGRSTLDLLRPHVLPPPCLILPGGSGWGHFVNSKILLRVTLPF